MLNWNFSHCSILPLSLLLCAPRKCQSISSLSYPLRHGRMQANPSVASSFLIGKTNKQKQTNRNHSVSLSKSYAPVPVHLHHCSIADSCTLCCPLGLAGPFQQSCFLIIQFLPILSSFIVIHSLAKDALHPTYQLINEGISQRCSLSSILHGQLTQTAQQWPLLF